MLIKIEMDLADEKQFDLFSEILVLMEKAGFHAGGSDTLKANAQPEETEVTP